MNEEKELEALQEKLHQLEERAEKRKKGVPVEDEDDDEALLGASPVANDDNKKRGWPEPGIPTLLQKRRSKGKMQDMIPPPDSPSAVASGVADVPPPVDPPPPREPSVQPEPHEIEMPRVPTPSEFHTPASQRCPEENYFHSSTDTEPVSQESSNTNNYSDAVLAYAQLIGIDLKSRSASSLMWIAEKGISAPLPQDWCWHTTEEGDVYYIHIPSRRTQWDHPLTERFMSLVVKHEAQLHAVITELLYLESQDWSLPLPRTKLCLTVDTFLEPATELFLHRSWAVDDVEYAGERCRIRLEQFPIDMLRCLESCTVTPAQPGLINLSCSQNSSGATVTQWAEVSENAGVIVCVLREHGVAPSSGGGVPRIEDCPHEYSGHRSSRDQQHHR